MTVHYQSASWARPTSNLIALTTYRNFDHQRLGDILSKIVFCRQTHSDRVIQVSSELVGRPTADAMITDQTNLGLGVLTADCVPVFIHDQKRSIIGIAHAGWRGTFYKIICKTINKIGDNFNVKPKDIIAVIGPSIGNCCFEVGEDLYKRFIKNFPNFKSCFLQDEFKKKIDLKRINYLLLEEMGVREIEILNECTKCNPNFYSYRRDKSKSQNQISKINLN